MYYVQKGDMFSIHSILESAREISIQHFGQSRLVVDIVLVYFCTVRWFLKCFTLLQRKCKICFHPCHISLRQEDK